MYSSLEKDSLKIHEHYYFIALILIWKFIYKLWI